MQIDKYSFKTEEEKEIYFIEKIIEQKEREIEQLNYKIEKIILTQMEKEKGI